MLQYISYLYGYRKMAIMSAFLLVFFAILFDILVPILFAILVPIMFAILFST